MGQLYLKNHCGGGMCVITHEVTSQSYDKNPWNTEFIAGVRD